MGQMAVHAFVYMCKVCACGMCMHMCNWIYIHMYMISVYVVCRCTCSCKWMHLCTEVMSMHVVCTCLHVQVGVRRSGIGEICIP